MTDFNIEHQTLDNRFIINLAEGLFAQLRYRLDLQESGTTEVDFFSTHVPDEYRGKGIAGLLVDKGFAWAEQNNMTIKTSCWYAQVKMKRRSK